MSAASDAATRRRVGQERLLMLAAAGVAIQIPLVTRTVARTQATQIVVSDVFLALLVLAGGFVIVRGRSLRWLLFLGYLALNALMLGSLSRYALVNKVGGLLLLVMACHAAIVVLRRAGPELAERVLSAMVNVTTVMAAIGLAAVLTDRSVMLPLGIRVNPFPQRVSGLMVDPNAFGGLLAVCLLVSLARWSSTDRARPWLEWARLTLLVAALVMTYSRTAWIAAAVGLAVWYWTSSTRTRVRLGVGLVTVAAMVVWGGFALPVDPELAGRQFTIDQRAQGALAALDDFARSPLVGIGTGNHVAENGFIVHNTYLWVLSELGFVGVLLFIWAVLGVVVALRSIGPSPRNVQRMLMCTLAVMAVMALGIEALYQRHLWMLIAIAYAAASTAPAVAEPDLVVDSRQLVGARRPGRVAGPRRGVS